MNASQGRTRSLKRTTNIIQGLLSTVRLGHPLAFCTEAQGRACPRAEGARVLNRGTHMSVSWVRRANSEAPPTHTESHGPGIHKSPDTWSPPAHAEPPGKWHTGEQLKQRRAVKTSRSLDKGPPGTCQPQLPLGARGCPRSTPLSMPLVAQAIEQRQTHSPAVPPQASQTAGGDQGRAWSAINSPRVLVCFSMSPLTRVCRDRGGQAPGTRTLDTAGPSSSASSASPPNPPSPL